MSPILECVPNISEGKDQHIITTLSNAIQSVEEVKLLHIDQGETAHRTVFTFAGTPLKVIEAAFRMISLTKDLIDMARHQGIHPRMGGTDVCPLIPVSGITMAETIVWAHKLAHRVGKELHIPVYAYEFAATAPHRKNLANIRSGEYEGFRRKIKEEKWMPDYGPAEFQPRTGQTVIGARNFLVAYNINLNTEDVSIAKRIAADIRESGRVKRGNGTPVIDSEGQPVRISGMCKHVKAIGWYVPEFHCAQVSTNLVNIEETPPHVAYEAVRTAAHQYGVTPTGSELIGLIPKSCLIRAGIFYAQNQNLPETEALSLAIEHLGLSQLSPFDPSNRVLEYLL